MVTGSEAPTLVSPDFLFIYFFGVVFFPTLKANNTTERISKSQAVKCVVDQVILLPAASVSHTWSLSLPFYWNLVLLILFLSVLAFNTKNVNISMKGFFWQELRC